MSEDNEIFQDAFDMMEGDLAEWVMGKCQAWKEHYESNYSGRHQEYMRLFRNQWANEDKMRESERSQLIAPALAQAVESNVAEIEEATFGRGKIFDIKDDAADQEKQDVVFLRDRLHADFKKARIRSTVAEVLINAAVYGTGIAEVVIDEIKEYKPATQPLMDGLLQEIGVNESYRPIVKLNPVQPQNFLIDPAATCVEEALGCAVDEFVSRHIVEELQEQGVYLDDELVGNAAADEEIEFNQDADSRPNDRVRLTKYYGKVPRDLLIEAGVEEDEIAEPGFYVESIVVIGNEGTVLKAIPNPYMCQDRPIVAFQWDIVPSTFWGRGVCEKGYMSQKALDAELRARIDALALTTHPMLAVDATRIPRGHKMEVRPGRMLLTNGAPSETIMPFNFGQLNGVTFQQGAQLQQMVSQATGAADGGQPAVQNDVTAAGMSMGQGAIVKRQKRTLLNFQENFLIPFVRKAAYRYMQFAPDQYPVKDYEFEVFSSLGAMAREYEVAQLSQVLQMVGPDSPAHGAIIKGIIDHLNVSNREEMMAAIDAANNPDPEAQKKAQQQQEQQMQMQMALTQGQIQLLNAQASESSARGQKYQIEGQMKPQELALKYGDMNQDGKADDDFEKKLKLAELMLKEKELQGKQDKEMVEAKTKAEMELMKQIMGDADARSNNASPNQEDSGPASGGF
jgi:hypothetical protein